MHGHTAPRIAAEIGAIVLILGARISGWLPLPAWPFLLLIAVGFGARPWQLPENPSRGSPAKMLLACIVVGIAYQFFTIFVEAPVLEWLYREPETPPNVDGLVGNVGGLLVFSSW